MVIQNLSAFCHPCIYPFLVSDHKDWYRDTIVDDMNTVSVVTPNLSLSYALMKRKRICDYLYCDVVILINQMWINGSRIFPVVNLGAEIFQ